MWFYHKQTVQRSFEPLRETLGTHLSHNNRWVFSQ